MVGAANSPKTAARARANRMSIFDSIEPLYSVSGFGVGFLIGMTGMAGRL